MKVMLLQQNCRSDKFLTIIVIGFIIIAVSIFIIFRDTVGGKIFLMRHFEDT